MPELSRIQKYSLRVLRDLEPNAVLKHFAGIVCNCRSCGEETTVKNVDAAETFVNNHPQHDTLLSHSM